MKQDYPDYDDLGDAHVTGTVDCLDQTPVSVTVSPSGSPTTAGTDATRTSMTIALVKRTLWIIVVDVTVGIQITATLVIYASQSEEHGEEFAGRDGDPMNVQRQLARRRLDERLALIRKTDLTPPRAGWLRAIRDALGMPARHLANELGLTTNAVFAMERSEQAGTIRLDTLRRAADALGCDVVYALVPRSSLAGTVEAAATQALRHSTEAVRRTMILEDQGLDNAELAAQERVLLNELIDSRDLWRA
jgi:predicted DNA-binding mobile mystery protein A